MATPGRSTCDGAGDDDLFDVRSRFESWEREFRGSARRDDSALLVEHLAAVGLPEDPLPLIEGTIQVVAACLAYCVIDSQEVVGFLQRQQYEPAGSRDAPYLLTFDLHGQGFARIATQIPFRPLDLVDIYGTAWERYKTVGYSQIRVSRSDGEPLGPDEIARVEAAVESDFRHDFNEDEVEFWFDPDTIEGVVIVTVQDADLGQS
jgi:hypothetical protein